MDALIEQAINSLHVLEFTYQGLHRIAEPHVFGYYNGKKQLLGYQIGGQSRSGGLPEWRRYDADGITGLGISNQTFPGPRPTVTGVHPNWDTIITLAK